LILPPYNLKNPGLDLDLFGLEDHHTAVAPCHDRIAKRLVASERFPNCLSGRSHQHIGVEAGVRATDAAWVQLNESVSYSFLNRSQGRP